MRIRLNGEVVFWILFPLALIGVVLGIPLVGEFKTYEDYSIDSIRNSSAGLTIRINGSPRDFEEPLCEDVARFLMGDEFPGMDGAWRWPMGGDLQHARWVIHRTIGGVSKVERIRVIDNASPEVNPED